MKTSLPHLSSLLLLVALLGLSAKPVLAQAADAADEEETDDKTKPYSAATFKGLKFRQLGPAFYAGRIADVAVNPTDDSEWYVAVGSGGVWKTTNAGVSFTPIFDEQKVFSTGCVTIDPHNPERIWVGTGENLGGRHFSWGDGVYLSEDAGKSWKNMGLKRSEHVSKIVVHPADPNTVWVASQGPLWSKGGQRGVYKSTDGGATWKRTLGDDAWTGATELHVDPRDPDRLYAATWDRHRTVAAYMGGGPGTALYRSEDGGDTWTKLTKGLPKGNLGKIGLVLSPQNPDVVYAAIETQLKEGGLWRSEDRGASWTKMSDKIAGGTGPHYYQELWASPHHFDHIYFANNYLQFSRDGGKTWSTLEGKGKHVDNHAMAFRADDPDYLLIGTDGGLYETFDHGDSWRHFSNMPLGQFYDIALDDAEPFYNVYGGTQDNSTQGGPVRTDNTTGVRNADWSIVNGGDGHMPATEPGNPDVVYAQSQQGYLNRIDMTTGEHVSVRPQPAAGEPYERYNWDAPIHTSRHDPKRLYFASQRLWRSDDRGDSWTALSEDLTRDENRLALPIMGRTQSYDNPWDVYAMSNYNTITTIGESPVDEDVIWIGTDDGLIWRTTDGGANWTRKEVGSIAGIPARAFVNDIKADETDAATAYASLDNHKEGDYRPMLLKTTDGGKSWRKAVKGLPDTTLTWRVVQDRVDPDLMFAGTEFGVYFSTDRGEEWVQLKGGVPTISFRDLLIHPREHDLVGATFGRSLYVLDDISPLRGVDKQMLAQKPAALLPMRDADLYQPRYVLGGRDGVGSLGSGHFIAQNPEFGAVITYYLRDGYESAKVKRKKAEKAANKDGRDVAFPGYDALEAERLEDKPSLWLTVADAAGNVVRRIEAPVKKGIHRVAWDLRHGSMMPVSAAASDDDDDHDDDRPSGRWAEPGTYTVTLSKLHEGTWEQLDGPLEFGVKRLREGSLPAKPAAERIAYAKGFERLRADVRVQSERFGELEKDLGKAREAIVRSTQGDIAPTLATVRALEREMAGLRVRLRGQESRSTVGEKNDPTLYSRLGETRRAAGAQYGPTATAQANVKLIAAELAELTAALDGLEQRLDGLMKATASWDKPAVIGAGRE